MRPSNGWKETIIDRPNAEEEAKEEQEEMCIEVVTTDVHQESAELSIVQNRNFQGVLVARLGFWCQLLASL